MSQLRRYAPFVVPTVALLLFVALSPVRTRHAPVEAQPAVAVARGAAPPGVPVTGGDRRHCVGGRQFAGISTAPPCEPDWTGRPNGGATSTGVTGSTIEVVFYREQPNPRLVALQRPLGGYSSPANDKSYLAVAARFVNREYELWNRRIHVDYVLGNCQEVNPDPACFDTDARNIVRRYHPFAVVYPTDTDAPSFFETLTQLRVVSIGGWNFPAPYDVAQRPYHYDAYPDGGTQAQITGQYWCRRLAGRPARFAGDPVLRRMRRKAGIVVVESNKASANELAAVIDRCDPGAARVYPYSADTGTTIRQSVTSVAAMKRAGVTDLIWYSDPGAPYFFTRTATAQRYFPENVLAGSGLLDNDTYAQQYDQQQWEHAFGPSDMAAQTATATADAIFAWHSGGGAGRPLRGLSVVWTYLGLLASGLQQAGPTLTPATFERGMLSLPPTGGGDSGHPLMEFGPGDYTALSDARSVAWDASRRSPVNGKLGTYVPLDGGRRFTPDAWPRSEPDVGSVQP